MKKLLLVAVAVVTLCTSTVTAYNLGLSQKPSTEYQSRVSSTTVQLVNVDELHGLVNKYRAELGLKPLERNSTLDITATEKCNDLVARNYQSHNTPEGEEPWVAMKKHITYYNALGENLATHYDTSSKILQGWINSEAHRTNLINSAFTSVGYARCQSDNYLGDGPSTIVVQHFLG